MDKNRVAGFQKNENLEIFSATLNEELWNVEKKLVEKYNEPQKPIIFIVGTHRSGSTLLLQWLASIGEFAYPSNLISRFYKAPILGAKIQILLTDERYNFRDELKAFIHNNSFRSDIGKTKGPLEPNEFWYFWRRFINPMEMGASTDCALRNEFDRKTFVSELGGMVDVFNAPFALKAMIINYNIPFFSNLFEKVLFIHLKRDPLRNIDSALSARAKHTGNIENWHSFKIPEFSKLKTLSPVQQVAGQIYSIDRAVTKGLESVSENKKVIVRYEKFCENPELLYNELAEKLNMQNAAIRTTYKGRKSFTRTKQPMINPKIEEAYLFIKKII